MRKQNEGDGTIWFPLNRFRLWPIVIAPLLLCAYFLPCLLNHEILFSVDTQGWTYPLRRWWVDGLVQGEWRLWNPYHFAGIYLPGSPGVGIFSPFNLLLALIPSPVAMHFIALITGCVGSIGMYQLVRRLTGQASSALFASIAYPLSGYVLSSVHNYGYFAGACIYPWALWSYFRGHKLFPLLLAWIVFEGDPFGALLIGSFTLAHGRNLKTFAQVGLAILLSAIAWLPGIVAASETLRARPLPYPVSVLFSLSPRQLVQWVWPSYWGFFNDSTFRGGAFTSAVEGERFWVDSIYFGLLPLALVILAVVKRRQKRLLLLCAVCLILAMGKYAGLYSVFYQFFPGWDRMRYPSRFYAFFNLGVILIAARELARLPSRWMWALVTLTACEMILRAPPLRTVKIESLTTPSGIAPHLQARENPSFRLLRDGSLDFTRGANPSRQTLADDWATNEGIASVFGYEPTQPSRLYPLMRPEVFRSLESWKRVLGAEYVLGSLARPPEGLKEWKTVARWPERDLGLWKSSTTSQPFEIFFRVKVAASAPAALEGVKKRESSASYAIVEDSIPRLDGLPGESQAKYRRIGPTEIEVQYATKKPALIVLRERFHPEWKAYVASKSLPIYRADFLNPAVLVPPGLNTLRYVFEPKSFYFGFWISLLSALSYLALSLKTIPWRGRSWIAPVPGSQSAVNSGTKPTASA